VPDIFDDRDWAPLNTRQRRRRRRRRRRIIIRVQLR